MKFIKKSKTISGIISERVHNKYRSYQIVSKWEDTISNKLEIPLYKAKSSFTSFSRRIKKLNLDKLIMFLDSIRPVRKYYLYFQMDVHLNFDWSCTKNIIPIIIDFWLKEDQLTQFYKNYRNCKLILITSLEVYVFLKERNCPLPIKHFPISIPDEYVNGSIKTNDRPIDFLLAGRTNPTFLNYIKKFSKDNLQIEYVYQEVDGLKPYYISNKRGRIEEDFFLEENYHKLLGQSKITFYVTPGKDPAKKGANGYNQVTPRFLEFIAAGCVVFGNYPINPDTEFYELSTMCFQVSSYQEFKKNAEVFLDDDFAKNHIQSYKKYLNKHLTTTRVLMLKIILKDFINK